GAGAATVRDEAVVTGSSREGRHGHGYVADRQAAPDRCDPAGERPPPDRGEPADSPAARAPAPAGDQGAGAVGHYGADEEHYAGAVPAGAPGGRGDRLRVRLRRAGTVPGGRLQTARQRRPGPAADPERVPHVPATRAAADHRRPDQAAPRVDPG